MTAKAYLKNYLYSSYLDLVGMKRPEGAILSTKEFPGYFARAVEFQDLVNEWMHFEDEGKPFKESADESEEGEDLMAQFLGE